MILRLMSEILGEQAVAGILLGDKGEAAIQYPERGEEIGSLILDKDFISDNKYRRVVTNTTMPLKPRVLETGQPITRPATHYPIAEWDKEHLKIAIPKRDLTKEIASSLAPSIVTLVTDNARHIASEQLFREKLSLDLQQERGRLFKKAKSSQAAGHKHLEIAKTQLAAAARQRKLADELDILNSKTSEDVATVQWRDICSLIPTTLQDVYMEENTIVALTQQFFVEGCILGPYQISISLANQNNDPMIHINTAPGVPVPSTQHPHPHVSPGGGPCWGTLVNDVAEMTAKRDYFGLLSAALRLLAQYRPDDHYTPITAWGKRIVMANSDSVCESEGDLAPLNFNSLFQIKQCLLCEAPHEDRCPVWTREALYRKCMTLSKPHDCVECEHTDCPRHPMRFDYCFASVKRLGTAYCMLKCEHTKDCPHLEEAKQLCAATIPEGETCPASDRCCCPCEKK